MTTGMESSEASHMEISHKWCNAWWFEVKKAREMILELRLGTASINSRIGQGHEKTKMH